MNMYGKSYINKLKASARRFTTEKRFSATSYTPLVQQIKDMTNSMPANVTLRPWTMSELVARLDGRYRARPHPQKVAEALRMLGWVRVRYWGKGFDGARLWMPPNCLTATYN